MDRSTSNAAPTPEQRVRRDALERLYVLWMVSIVLLLGASLTPALLLRASLRAQNEAIERLSSRLTDAESALAALRTHFTAAASPAGQPVTASVPHTESAPHIPDEKMLTAAPAAADSISGPRIESELARIVDEPEPGEFVLNDETAGRATLALAAKAAPGKLNGRTCERLAIVAEMLQKPQEAADFAQRGAAAGRPPLRFFALAARIELANGHAADALAHARQLAEHAPASPMGKVYMAAALLESGQAAAADELLQHVGELAGLTPRERLLAARVSAELEDWAHLKAALQGMPNVPAALTSERDFLSALSLLQQAHASEAFALLDNLSAAANAPAAGAGASGTLFPLIPTPGPAEIQMWRGVALLRSGQSEAARRTLDSAAQSWPERAPIWYWLGILDLKQRDFDAATRHLNNALARSAAFAPAWEALATVALERGDLEGALSHLASAVQANPRRASAHFLRAVVCAKAGRTEDSADSLRAAFALAPGLIEDAAQTDVLAKLFTLEQLRSFGTGAGSESGNGSAASAQARDAARSDRAGSR